MAQPGGKGEGKVNGNGYHEPEPTPMVPDSQRDIEPEIPAVMEPDTQPEIEPPESQPLIEPDSQPDMASEDDSLSDTLDDEGVQYYYDTGAGINVAVQGNPSPMAFMLASMIGQRFDLSDKGKGKGKNNDNASVFVAGVTAPSASSALADGRTPKQAAKKKNTKKSSKKKDR